MLKHFKRRPVAFSLSEEEHWQIRENAKRLGYRSVSEYVRYQTMTIINNKLNEQNNAGVSQ